MNAQLRWNLLKNAVALDNAGAFAMVLEGILREVAKLISEEVSVPTLAIGAEIRTALVKFKADVESGKFPADAESYHLPGDLRSALPEILKRVRDSSIS